MSGAAIAELEQRWSAQRGELGGRIERLREDNEAEFLAMKAAFDRINAKDAAANAFAPQGQSRRMF